MYKLMNKDKTVATFDISYVYADSICNIKWLDRMPFGCTNNNFENWIRARFASKHRKSIQEFMYLQDIESISDYIYVTKCLSINDTYWVTEDFSPLKWADVSLYRNEFNKVISDFFYDGESKQPLFNTTSPEFGTAGAYAKCWVKEDSGIYMYKRGSTGAFNAGLEPYSEYLASQIFTAMRSGIGYNLVDYRGVKASKCKLFTSEDYGYVPYSALDAVQTCEGIINYYMDLGCYEHVAKMLICDSITFNPDRHTGNHGIIVNNNNGDIVGMEVCFDYNLALMPMSTNDAFTNTTKLISRYTPYIGTDFVKISQMVLTPDITSDLKNLRGFKYEYEGDSKFLKERVDWLTVLSNNQIDNILGINKPVFYSKVEVKSETNLSKYQRKIKMTDDEFSLEISRLMRVFNVEHMVDLDEKVVELLE